MSRSTATATSSGVTEDRHGWPDTGQVVARLPRLPVAPATIDADALRARSVLPFGIRRS